MILLRLTIQTVVLALGQIWANKVRALLTTLGIVIGVAAVVATIAAVGGLRDYVLTEFETFGAKKVFFDGNVPRKLRGTMSWMSVQLKLHEIKAVQKNARSIDRVCPIFMSAYDLAAGDTVLRTVQVQGVWPDWHEIEGRYAIYGRTLNYGDEEQRLNVCVINEKAIEELDLDSDPTNDVLLVGGRRFLIIGVVETKQQGPMFGGGETQAEVYIPLATAMAMKPEAWINYCMAQLVAPDKAEEAKAEIGSILRKARKLRPEDEDTFEVEVLQSIIDGFNKVAGAITAAAGGIVAISLLVGGIGIMNIMLVSVSERTREIGLRKAVGARPDVILVQFLVEAVTLCLVGAGIGLVVGQALVFGLRAIPDSPMDKASIPTWAIILATGFSAGTGVIFGMFPAIKAARLNPIEALRHE